MLPALPSAFDPVAEFPILAQWKFFNHAGVAPIGARSAAAIRTYAEESQNDAYMTGKWYKQAEHVRRSAARLINADATEIAFIKNTSEGIAFVANGLDWKAGDEIVSTTVEYPSNVYPWMDLQKRLGVKLVLVAEAEGRILMESLFAAVTSRTRMMALSHVEYASGFRHDLAAIGKFCRERGILLCVDAIQSVGVVPVDVKGMNIDYLSADGHKWMLGPEGLGIFFCRKELLDTLRPEVGWMNVINATDYGNIDFTLRGDARRFECGTYNIPGILGLGAALDLLLEVGMETVWQRVLGLTSLLIEGLQRKGYRIDSPRKSGAETSGIVSFSATDRSKHDAIVQSLEAQKIIIVQREKRLRASPHFYMGESEIGAMVDALPAQ